MPNDIGIDLYEQIKALFDKKCAADKFISGDLVEEIAQGTATMQDVSLYSKQLGFHLRQAISETVTADVLPDGQMYYNIAEKILSPLLHNNYDLINDVAADVQKKLDAAKGIKIKPQKAPFPAERLKTVLNAASEPGLDEATMQRRMSVPAETITQSFADDYMQANARFRNRAGIQAYIVRKDDGKCCDWCAKLAGRYSYPEGTPNDVFRRHDNCGCTVTYESGDMRQNAWTKKTWQATPEELAERKELEEKNKPVRFSPEEAAAKEKELLAKKANIKNISLDNGAENGIIEESKAHKQMVEYLEALGVESVPTKPLSNILSESEIIDRLAGGDMTHGSCTSLAFAYAGNKGGVDVLDFRGGSSCEFFSKMHNIKDISKFNGVNAAIIKDTNSIKAATNLLKSAEPGKEYILSTGKHSAVVRRNRKGFEYLELQNPVSNNNGFKQLTLDVLKKRFKCTKSSTSYGFKLQNTSILIDRESLSNSEEFKSILEYINTKEINQMKGVKGYAK